MEGVLLLYSNIRKVQILFVVYHDIAGCWRPYGYQNKYLVSNLRNVTSGFDSG